MTLENLNAQYLRWWLESAPFFDILLCQDTQIELWFEFNPTPQNALTCDIEIRKDTRHRLSAHQAIKLEILRPAFMKGAQRWAHIFSQTLVFDQRHTLMALYTRDGHKIWSEFIFTGRPQTYEKDAEQTAFFNYTSTVSSW